MKYLFSIILLIASSAFAQELELEKEQNADTPVFSEDMENNIQIPIINEGIEQNLDGVEETEEPKIRVPGLPVDTVILQGLNKVTTKTYTIKANIGNTIKFGNLLIEIKSCWKSPPEERPENAVLMDIEENGERLFLGWMFSSSPAISALEHPVYDITVIECSHSEQTEE
jgi:hypothetical protein